MEILVQILKYPDLALFRTCAPVQVFGEELSKLLNIMFDLMITNNGIGLAANQVGIIYRMFTMLGPNDEKIFLVNPVITARSLAPANLREGCLSAPGEFLVLPERAIWVEVTFQNEKGEKRVRIFKDIYAVCIQHEMDHLLGKSHLESKSINKAKRKELAKKWGFR